MMRVRVEVRMKARVAVRLRARVAVRMEARVAVRARRHLRDALHRGYPGSVEAGDAQLGGRGERGVTQCACDME